MADKYVLREIFRKMCKEDYKSLMSFLFDNKLIERRIVCEKNRKKIILTYDDLVSLYGKLNKLNKNEVSDNDWLMATIIKKRLKQLLS